MQTIEKIALAGLLHDIGKFYQRAQNPNCNYPPTNFKHKHACLSYQWILENKDILKEVLNTDIEELANLASRHHNPSNQLEKIMQLADWFSSAEREKVLEDEINYLHSVFERVSFEEETDIGSRNFAYYKLRPLSLDEEDIFPKIYEGIFEGNQIKFFKDKTKKDIEKELGSYKKLFDDFQTDLKKLENFRDKQAFIFLYYLFQKYLWCVPASTYDIEKKSRHYPDISLFDHSRVLSAIASSIYDYVQKTGFSLEGKTKEVFERLEKENFLLLIEGDITGIQKFIYNIGKTQGIEDFSISKALRGRSFLVSLIPEILSRYILKELEYTIINLLYSGGGKFQLLVANTKENIEKINKIENKLNEFFFNKYGFELGIVLSYISFSGEYLTEKNGKSYSDIIEKNQIKLDEKKKRKSPNLLTKKLEDEKTIEKLCLSCKIMPVKENDLCILCRKSSEIGGVLPKIEYLIFDFENRNISFSHKNTFSLGKFGKVYLVSHDEVDKFKSFEEILKLNDTEFDKNNGFKFIGNTVPLIDERNQEFFKSLEDDEEKKSKIKPNQVVEFKYLAQLAEGDKKLGIFRADVDNLGLIFSDGLKRKDSKESNRYTISRLATLSRMLDLFFTGYINKLAEEVSSNSNEEKLASINSLIYIVYSGGDDLFIIAPYNIAIEFAQKLRESFYEFTCKNLNFGISGGIFISSSTLPIHLSAKYSESLESRAKKAYYTENDNFLIKDSISIFNKTYRWKELEGKNSLENILMKEIKDLPQKEIPEFLTNIGLSEKRDLIYFDKILKVVDEIVKSYKENSISKGFLYKLLELYNAYVIEGRITPSIYPKIYYQIGRNIKDKNTREFLENLLIKDEYEGINSRNIIKNLDVIISFVLMKIRGGE